MKKIGRQDTGKRSWASRVPGTHVKKILDEIAKKEFRSIGNLSEKLLCERLRDLGYLDDDFQAVDRSAE